MEQYTVRYAHLEKPSHLIAGDMVIRSDKIGRMGSSGKSTANHLHIDVIKGFIKRIIKLKEIGYDEENIFTPSLKQLNYFIDDKLFGTEIFITEYFGSPFYLGGVKHHAYDVVPENRHLEPGRNFDIHWNRSKVGLVLATGYDEFYGYYILIGFEA